MCGAAEGGGRDVNPTPQGARPRPYSGARPSSVAEWKRGGPMVYKRLAGFATLCFEPWCRFVSFLHFELPHIPCFCRRSARPRTLCRRKHLILKLGLGLGHGCAAESVSPWLSTTPPQGEAVRAVGGIFRGKRGRPSIWDSSDAEAGRSREVWSRTLGRFVLRRYLGVLFHSGCTGVRSTFPGPLTAQSAEPPRGAPKSGKGRRG